MFYEHLGLFKRGPLARIWLAAHWDDKITKAHVLETNIEKSVNNILQPNVKMALRTSSHLLLGVVRIYSRKAKYLLDDCNEASVKIKMAFRPGMINLPEQQEVAAVTAITLPEVFHDFDTFMPELEYVDIEARFSLNQSRAEEITMREDYDSLSLVTHDQGFGDMSFDSEPPELLRHDSGMRPSLDLHQSHILFGGGPGMEAALKQKEKDSVAGTSAAVQPMDIDTPIRDDGFGGHLGQGLFESNLFDQASISEVPISEVSSITEQQETGAASETAASVHDESDENMGDHFDPRFPMGGMSSDGYRPAIPAATGGEIDGRISVASRCFTPVAVISEEHAIDNVEEPPSLQDQTTLLHDDEESFVLPPIDAFILEGFTKTKCKRKLIIDKVKNVSDKEMKAQLSNTSDIVTTLYLAPPTKRLMHWKETGDVKKLFALPGNSIPSRVLFKNYQRHLTNKSYNHEDFGRLGSKEDNMVLEQMRDAPEEPSIFEQSILNKHTERKRKVAQDDDIKQPPQPPQPTPVDVSLSANAVEAVEIPSMITPHNLPAESSEVPLPAEPSISDISSIVPSKEPSIIPSNTETSLVNLEIAPGETSSLDIREETQVSQEKTTIQQTSDMLQMEKMGYDHAQSQVSYVGYDEHHPLAHTSGAISEREPTTPWNHEDYEFPPSPQEEPQMNETYKQFEERVLNKRAAHMYHVIKSKLDTKDKLTLSDTTFKNNRKQVACKFYTLLVLAKSQILKLNQEYSYAEIIITKGPKFEDPAL